MPDQKRSQQRDQFLKAALFVTIGFCLVPGMDAIAKTLSSRYPVAQLAWARFVFHLLFVVPLVILSHRDRIWPSKPFLQLTRGVCQMAATFLFFAAIARMPIADALAILFTYPLIVTVLSAPFLGERVQTRQWVALSLGLLGVLCILRPGLESFQPAGLLALAAGTCFGIYILVTRKVSGSSPPLVTLTYSALVGAVVLSAAAPSFWVRPQATDWLLMVGMGFLAASGHLMIIRGFELAAASALAPFGYVEMIAATAFGYWLFGEFPDPLAWLGITIIIGSALLSSSKMMRRAPQEQ